LGTLAVGLGIGLAVASTPGVAVADSSADWLDDLFGGAALPATAVPDVNLAISIDGYSLVSEGTASANSGSGDFAIAYGDGASASAVGGTGDFALADGSGAYAGAGGSDATDNLPGATGDTGADDDTAIDIGNNSGFGFTTGAVAGNVDLVGGPGGGTSSGDTAIDIGNNNSVIEGNVYPFDGAFAGDGGLLSGEGTGDDDTAVVVGTNNLAGAVGGNTDVANVVGTNSFTFAGLGNDDVGSVFDPLGTAGSGAYAGFSGNSDLAAVFGDGLNSTSTNGGDFLYDILSPSGDLPGSTSGLLAELLSLF
jgi:hypothetical protein